MIWLKLKLETAALLLRESEAVANQYERLNALIKSQGTMDMVQQMTKLRQSISNRIQQIGKFYEGSCMDLRSKIILKAKLTLIQVLQPVTTTTVWFRQQRHPLKQIQSSRSLSRVSTNTRPYNTTQNKTPNKIVKPLNQTKHPSKILMNHQKDNELKKYEKKMNKIKKPAINNFQNISQLSRTEACQDGDQTIITIKMSKQEYEELVNSIKNTTQ